MYRNVGVIIFALPVMQLILLCLAIGGEPEGLKVAIVNGELQDTTVCPFDSGCKLWNLSCRYLSHLNSTIIKEFYSDPESAVEAVRVGHAWGALYFTDNFTDALVARIALGEEADEETLDQSEIRLWQKMSNQQINIVLKRELQLTYKAFEQDLNSDCDRDTEVGDIPIQYKDLNHAAKSTP